MIALVADRQIRKEASLALVTQALRILKESDALELRMYWNDPPARFCFHALLVFELAVANDNTSALPCRSPLNNLERSWWS